MKIAINREGKDLLRSVFLFFINFYSLCDKTENKNTILPLQFPFNLESFCFNISIEGLQLDKYFLTCRIASCISIAAVSLSLSDVSAIINKFSSKCSLKIPLSK